MVRQTAKFVNPPTTPRPHLRRNQMHDARTALLHSLAHRKIRGGRIDWNMNKNLIDRSPSVNLASNFSNCQYLVQSWNSHRSIIRSSAHHFCARGFHATASPCDNSQLWIQSTKFANDGSCVRIPRGFERSEENDRRSSCHGQSLTAQ
jgi:hypothetical protein